MLCSVECSWLAHVGRLLGAETPHFQFRSPVVHSCVSSWLISPQVPAAHVVRTNVVRKDDWAVCEKIPPTGPARGF